MSDPKPGEDSGFAPDVLELMSVTWSDSLQVVRGPRLDGPVILVFLACLWALGRRRQARRVRRA